ncbi:MAG: hypothetical protein HY394_05950 [Candidatus Diapherotrites archaeon]|nr:hypothetical protein [Candidatus Diapherotrites archaeon]
MNFLRNAVQSLFFLMLLYAIAVLFGWAGHGFMKSSAFTGFGIAVAFFWILANVLFASFSLEQIGS